MGKIASCYETGERYKSLRIVGGVFTFTGAILLLIGGLMFTAALYALLADKVGAPPVESGPLKIISAPGSSSLSTGLHAGFFLFWSIAILFAGLESIAFGALIRLLIHMEENTRVSALALEKLRMSLEAKREGEPHFLS